MVRTQESYHKSMKYDCQESSCRVVRLAKCQTMSPHSGLHSPRTIILQWLFVLHCLLFILDELEFVHKLAQVFIGWPSNTSSFQYCFFRLDASNLCLLVSASGRPWHILCTQVAISKLLAMTWELCFIYVFRPNRSPFNFSTTLKVLLCFPVLALHPVAQPWSRILQNLSFIPQQSFSVLIILLYVSHCDCWWTILRLWW